MPFAIPALAAIGGGSALAGGLTLAGTAGGLALQAKGISDAKKAANRAANTPAPTVDINALDAQAREFARRNAIEGQALENELAPELGQLRQQSVLELINSIAGRQDTNALASRIAATAGQEAEAGLLRDAIAQARGDLALGGRIPLDVQNAVTRRALSRAGNTGDLGLGRDVVARDLGLTSLDLMNRRLQNASSLGAAEAGLQTAGRQDLFDAGSFLAALQSGDFARALGAAQLGQSIAIPETGLDPASVVNLAVGNTNAAATKAQQDAALRVQAGNQASQLGSQLFGAGLGYFQNQLNKPKTTVYTPAPGMGGIG